MLTQDTTKEQERELVVSKFGEEFAAHVYEVFADDSLEIDFCICGWCGMPYPKLEDGMPGEMCSQECFDAQFSKSGGVEC